MNLVIRSKNPPFGAVSVFHDGESGPQRFVQQGNELLLFRGGEAFHLFNVHLFDLGC